MKRKLILLLLLGSMVCISGCGKTNVDSGEESVTEMTHMTEMTDNDDISAKDAEDSENKRNVTDDYLAKVLSGVSSISDEYFLVEMLDGKGNDYIVDLAGNFVVECLDNTSVSGKYMVTTSGVDKIKIFNLDTREDITPDGIAENLAKSAKWLLRDDIICTLNASYDLTTGECLWSDDEAIIPSYHHAIDSNNGLINYKGHTYNYKTGKILTAGYSLQNSAFNAAGQVAIWLTDGTVLVVDADGNELSRFVWNDKKKDTLSKEIVVAGEHFYFYNNNSTKNLGALVDINGNIVLDNIEMDGSDVDNDLDESINAVCTDDGRLIGADGTYISEQIEGCKFMEHCYNDIYLYSVPDYTVIWNKADNKELKFETLKMPRLASAESDNKLIYSIDGMYNAETFEKIPVDLKENEKFAMATKDVFLVITEGEDDKVTSVVSYDYTGKKIKELDLEGGKHLETNTGTIVFITADKSEVKFVNMLVSD